MATNQGGPMTPHADLVARLLRELVTLVRGESPALLNEDSGGDARLSLAIDDALAALPPPADPPHAFGCQCGCSFSASPPADPPSLVARLLQQLRAWGDGDEADNAVIAAFEAEAYPLPAAPPVPETPQGYVSMRAISELIHKRSANGGWLVSPNDLRNQLADLAAAPAVPPQEGR